MKGKTIVATGATSGMTRRELRGIAGNCGAIATSGTMAARGMNEGICDANIAT